MPIPKSIIDQSVSILNESFDKYRIACYGNTELPARQLHEVKRAYLSGIVWFAGRSSTNTLLPVILCKAVASILELDPSTAAAIDEVIADGG